MEPRILFVLDGGDKFGCVGRRRSVLLHIHPENRTWQVQMAPRATRINSLKVHLTRVRNLAANKG